MTSGSWRRKERKRLGKIQPHLGVHVYLVDAFEVDFHRVFGGGNIALGGVENIQAGIERNGFTGAGGAGDQNHALGLVQDFHVQLFLLGFVAQRVDAHLRAAWDPESAARFSRHTVWAAY